MQSQLRSISIFLCILPCFVQSQSGTYTLKDLDWLSGMWCMEKSGKQFCEQWQRLDENSMAGTSLIILDRDTLVLENMLLQEVAGHIIYITAPRGQKMTGFPLHTVRGNTWIFENLEHDMPQRILYRHPLNDTLRMRIEGRDNGVIKIKTFQWTRIPETVLHSTLQKKYKKMSEKKVTGIGGIFFKSKDPAATKAWYAEHLGLATNAYGSMFEFRLADKPEQKGYLQWTPFDAKTDYFAPSEKPFMINYRVADIEALVKELKANDVTILDEIVSYPYGKFVHILDPEGNKIELWEPADEGFSEYEGDTTH